MPHCSSEQRGIDPLSVLLFSLISNHAASPTVADCKHFLVEGSEEQRTCGWSGGRASSPSLGVAVGNRAVAQSSSQRRHQPRTAQCRRAEPSHFDSSLDVSPFLIPNNIIPRELSHHITSIDSEHLSRGLCAFARAKRNPSGELRVNSPRRRSREPGAAPVARFKPLFIDSKDGRAHGGERCHGA